jgi:hypothetical protein
MLKSAAAACRSPVVTFQELCASPTKHSRIHYHHVLVISFALFRSFRLAKATPTTADTNNSNSNIHSFSFFVGNGDGRPSDKHFSRCKTLLQRVSHAVAFCWFRRRLPPVRMILFTIRLLAAICQWRLGSARRSAPH